MNQHIRYHQMSIKGQYMSNICQAQMKGEWDNETDKRNEREQEKGPRGASRSKGLKALSLRVRRFKDFKHHAISQDVARQMKCLEFEDSKALETLWWFHKEFPLTEHPCSFSLLPHPTCLQEMTRRWR